MNSPSQNSKPARTRRGFLAQTGAIGVGAAMARSLATPRQVHAGADDTLKLALIGCGSRGTGAVAQALSTSGAGQAVGHGRRL